MKKHGKASLRVVEKCPDIPVAVVQYTFTHKQYTEKHNETEYSARYVSGRLVLNNYRSTVQPTSHYAVSTEQLPEYSTAYFTPRGKYRTTTGVQYSLLHTTR
jgi:hypothetical protein